MRVLIARPRLQAEATLRRLAAIGLEGLMAPVLEIVPTGAPRPAGPFDAILIASANAAPSLGPDDGPVFAVGRRTASAAAEAGCRNVVCADGDAADLARLVRRDLRAGASLLHVAGRDRRAEPALSLRAAGFELTAWECYQARAVPALPESAAEALAGGTMAAALHYSARSARQLERLVREAGLAAPFAALRHVCLSADIAAALDVAADRLAVAARPEEDSLMATLQAALGQGSHPPGRRC